MSETLIDAIDNTNKITHIDIKSNRKHTDQIDRGEERQSSRQSFVDI